MKKNFRTIEFTNVSDQKFDDLKKAVQSYVKTQVDKAVELGLPTDNKEEELKNHLELTDFLFEAFVARMKTLNDSMNELADYANNNKLGVCPELIFKIQAFLDSIGSMDFIKSMYDKRIIGGSVTMDDLCTGYKAIMDKGLQELNTPDDISNKYQKVMDMIDKNESVDHIIDSFKEVLVTIVTDELCFLIDKISYVQTLKVMLPTDTSPEFKKMDTVMTKILILCKDELDRRQASN
jgi:hypothetical protein